MYVNIQNREVLNKERLLLLLLLYNSTAWQIPHDRFYLHSQVCNTWIYKQTFIHWSKLVPDIIFQGEPRRCLCHWNSFSERGTFSEKEPRFLTYRLHLSGPHLAVSTRPCLGPGQVMPTCSQAVLSWPGL